MSLQHAANHLAAHGRGPDTQLVHMAPGEVRSLQQLAQAHGGSLTTNPKTGLPEAGFLSSILPTVIGAGITYFSGGTIPAWQVGLGMGAAGTLATGSLSKGLMAGLGAYGGSSLAGGLMGAGASTAGATAGALGVDGAATGAGSQAARLAAQNAGFGQAGLESLGSSAAVAQGATPVVQSAGQSMLGGVQGLTSAEGRNALLAELGGGKGLAKAGLAAASPLLASSLTKQYDATAVPAAGDSKMPQRLEYNTGRPTDAQGNAVTPQADVPTYETGMGSNFGREQDYFPKAGYEFRSDKWAQDKRGYADGGDVQFPYGESVVRMADGGGAVEPTPDFQQPYTAMARGGLSDLGGYSDGGRLLKGPGDGVSDSIPATIGNKRPARLADGEFVVPARIVSELGNGSTEAGARKLYAMLDRVQAARKKSIGKGKVAKNSRADKLLPA